MRVACVLVCVSQAAWSQEKSNPEVLSDTTVDGAPPVESHGFHPRRGPAFTIATGVSGLGVLTPQDNYSTLGTLFLGRAGWFVGDQFIMDGQLQYIRGKDNGAAGVDVSFGAEFFFQPRAVFRFDVGFGGLYGDSISKHFAFALGLEARYAIISAPGFDIAVGARIHGLTSELKEFGEDSAPGEGSLLSAHALISVQFFGVRRHPHAPR